MSPKTISDNSRRKFIRDAGLTALSIPAISALSGSILSNEEKINKCKIKKSPAS